MRKRQSREEWSRLLAEKARSEQTVEAFCTDRGLGVHQYYYWQRTLSESTDDGFVELRSADVDSGVSVDLDTMRVHLRGGFDEATLLRLLAVAKRC